MTKHKRKLKEDLTPKKYALVCIRQTLNGPRKPKIITAKVRKTKGIGYENDASEASSVYTSAYFIVPN